MKELKIKPEEAFNIVCDTNDKYQLLELHEASVYYGDMTTEYNFDVIFEDKESKEQFVIENLIITEGSARWFENFDSDLDFLDHCEKDEIEFFIAKKGVWNNKPRFYIES